MFAGIDIGSLTCKAVVFDGVRMVSCAVIPTGGFPRKSGEAVLRKACESAAIDLTSLQAMVCTGYGRSLLAHCKAVTEITCCAQGGAFLSPDIGMIIDIGGQDSKVVHVDAQGRPSGFLTNEKCAAGTGRFLETIARALELEVDEMALLGHDDDPVQISSTCAVFAESEVVGLLASEIPLGKIVAGINQSIVDRTVSLVHRLGLSEKIMLCGGVAKNEGIRKTFAKVLDRALVIPDNPQIVAAIGAAIIASR